MTKFLLIVLSLFSLNTYALSLDLPDGESSDVEVYSGDDKKYEIIYMHGKSSIVVIDPAEVLFKNLSSAGYTVYTAQMPWGREKYRGTMKTANLIIDRLATKIRSKGKRVVLMGHSMGASYAINYAAQYGDKLAGIVPIALGHVPQMNERFHQETAQSVARAKQMVASGKGKEATDFNDLNKGESYEIEATAEYYKSFYDPATYPNVSEQVEQVKVPTLWISGRRDRLTDLYEHENLFNTLPANSKNSYELIKGRHVSVLKFCSETVIDWLNEL